MSVENHVSKIVEGVTELITTTVKEAIAEALRDYISTHEHIVEEFDGFVDSFEGETAHVTLTSKLNQEVMHVGLKVSELKEKGIDEYCHFTCQTIDVKQIVKFNIKSTSKYVETDLEYYEDT